MAPLTPTVTMISGFICQPFYLSFSYQVGIFTMFSVVASMGNLSWQYVISMNWIVREGSGVAGGGGLWIVIRGACDA